MNRYYIILSCFILAALLLSPALFSLNEIENQPAPAKIREVSLKKVLEFTDDGDTFYFKYPRKISADAEQNIYILDGKRLMKFSKDGTYIKNMVREGEGPGEVTYISNFLVMDKKIIVHSNYPPKIIHLKKDGSLIKEFRLKNSKWGQLKHYYNDTYYFYDSSEPEKGEAKIVDLDQKVFSISGDGQTTNQLFTFPVKTFVVVRANSYGAMNAVGFYTAFIKDQYFFVTENPKYLIKRFDLKTKKISRRFASQYQSVESPAEYKKRFEKSRMIINGKKYQRPIMKHFDDIRLLLVYGNHLWAFTSTFDQEKGARVDVYDFEGKRTDCFFLDLPGKTDPYSYKCNIVDNFLYVLDKNEDGETTVLKYAIDF